MKPFRYLQDSLFLTCLVLYFGNRLIFKTYFPNTFSQAYLNDLICIPFWVPIMLFSLRKAGLRLDDSPPTSSEILIPLIAWAFLFEIVAPYSKPLRGSAFCDPKDVLCYTVGALLAAVIWHFDYSRGAAENLEA